MAQFKRIKDGTKIGFPCNPAYFVNREFTKVFEIKMTCGNNMFGNNIITEYIIPQELPGNQLIEVTRWNGEKIMINTGFVTHVENFVLIKVKTDSNHKELKGLRTNTFLIKDGENVEFVNQYTYDVYN